IALSLDAIWFPLLVLELYIFALALAFFLSAAYVKFRDINYLWEVVMQAAFYATPILYPVGLVVAQSELAAKLLMLNPMAQIIQDARYVLVTQDSVRLYDLVEDPFIVAIPFVVVACMVVFASIYFKKSSKYFAENV
ncbi:MAG: ABC transporter permease, partial [Acidobacteriota bacterium]